MVKFKEGQKVRVISNILPGITGGRYTHATWSNKTFENKIVTIEEVLEANKRYSGHATRSYNRYFIKEQPNLFWTDDMFVDTQTWAQRGD